jgi:hypothetical protein
VNDANLKPFVTFSKSRERHCVLALCCLAAVHVFVFSAAFPFNNNMDECSHFDLVVKYAHGHLPRGLESMCEEASQYILVYSSPEYRWPPADLKAGTYPPPFWLRQTGSPAEKLKRAEAFQQAAGSWRALKNLDVWKNYESSQQPLYYAIAAPWWRLGQALGWEGLRAVYWLRFLNGFFVAALVGVGYGAVRLLFPENRMMRLGLPALLALFPQQAFYSIQNDVLSPLCFGVVFIGLIKLWRAERPDLRWGLVTGLALAAAFLVKLSNAPLIAVAAAVVLWKVFRLWKNGGLRASVPALLVLLFCAALPVCAWLAWTRHAFGDFTGTAAKTDFLTWTHKPFAQWWHHPIFSPQGFVTFISGLLVAFWQGEFRWAGSPLDLPVPDAIYAVLSLSFLALAPVKLRLATAEQRGALWLSLGFLAAGTAFLGYLSISYDFGLCPNPSKEFPYFIAGRLLLGALIPFLLLFLYGMHGLLFRANPRIRFAALVAMLLFMLVSEIITDRAVFASQYNWFHL